MGACDSSNDGKRKNKKNRQEYSRDKKESKKQPQLIKADLDDSRHMSEHDLD